MTLRAKAVNRLQVGYWITDNALYLLVKDDATLSVVNDQLEEAASGMNYDLKVVK